MPKLHQHEYICIGPNCWGRGEVPEDAFKNCIKNWPKYGWDNRRKPKIYIDAHVYRCPKGSTVDSFDGSIHFPPKTLRCLDCGRIKENLSDNKKE